MPPFEGLLIRHAGGHSTASLPADARLTTARAWHAESATAALSATASQLGGLSEALARDRLARDGPNRLPTRKPRSGWRRLASQFNNVLIGVLLVSGALALLMRHWVDATVILGVVAINAVVGFLQEGKAEQALLAIRETLAPEATVLREGLRRVIPAEQVVVGDVVLLQSGDRVPADLRLLSVRNLAVQEAVLTGESSPVEKATEPVAASAALGDRTSMAFAGTLVVRGHARGVVVATASATELGQTSSLLATVEKLETPLLAQIRRFSRALTAAILGMAAATFAFGVLARGHLPAHMFMASVGLAVAAIPEGLPAVISITLAIGVRRMAGRKAIIRHLPAVETLGAVSVICTDKTGTLTRNEMTVETVDLGFAVVDVEGSGYAPEGAFRAAHRALDANEQRAVGEFAAAAAQCCDARLTVRDGQWTVDGDPTEGALLTLALKAGLDLDRQAALVPRTDVLPFESDQRFMATLHHDHLGCGHLFLKGAPEVVLRRCERQRAANGGEQALDREYWQDAVARIGAGARRAIAVAYRRVDEDLRALRGGDVEAGLTLLGMCGIADPPRPEAVEAVRRCQQAGIAVKMTTGDHATTATAVGAAVGLRPTAALRGPDLERLDPPALSEAVETVDVFARMSPADKLRLVTALQARGHIVAMTGDGINDAPALKRSDVGIAMGRKGTEAAREAAEMVLADDNFASIVNAVEEGRTVYDNITKAVTFILPTNIGEAAIIVAAVLLGATMPITALQVLWVNMVTAVTLALAFAFEPAERDVMRRPPRLPQAPILSRFLAWRVAFVSTLLAAGVFALFVLEQRRGASVEAARTAAVNALVFGEVVYLLNSRRLMSPALSRVGRTRNPLAWGAVALVMALQVLFTYAAPMHALFDSRAMSLLSWLRLVALGGGTFLLVEAEKAIFRAWSRRRRRTDRPFTQS